MPGSLQSAGTPAQGREAKAWSVPDQDDTRSLVCSPPSSGRSASGPPCKTSRCSSTPVPPTCGCPPPPPEAGSLRVPQPRGAELVAWSHHMGKWRCQTKNDPGTLLWGSCSSVPAGAFLGSYRALCSSVPGWWRWPDRCAHRGCPQSAEITVGLPDLSWPGRGKGKAGNRGAAVPLPGRAHLM